jgi:hypothetical protein
MSQSNRRWSFNESKVEATNHSPEKNLVKFST